MRAQLYVLALRERLRAPPAAPPSSWYGEYIISFRADAGIKLLPDFDAAVWDFLLTSLGYPAPEAVLQATRDHPDRPPESPASVVFPLKESDVIAGSHWPFGIRVFRSTPVESNPVFRRMLSPAFCDILRACAPDDIDDVRQVITPQALDDEESGALWQSVPVMPLSYYDFAIDDDEGGWAVSTDLVVTQCGPRMARCGLRVFDTILDFAPLGDDAAEPVRVRDRSHLCALLCDSFHAECSDSFWLSVQRAQTTAAAAGSLSLVALHSELDARDRHLQRTRTELYMRALRGRAQPAPAK